VRYYRFVDINREKTMPVQNKLKSFLADRNITRYQFGKDVGLAPGTAYELYKDPNRLPNSSVLAKICDLYEVQPSELIEWIPPIAPRNHG
jgi:DNA-binding Xre family transcriptional regulator